MKFHGFESISAFEKACWACGQTAKRLPFQKDGKEYFVLVTGMQRPTPTSIEGWHLFTMDESELLLEGVINGCDANYLGKLAAHGFYPGVPVTTVS